MLNIRTAELIDVAAIAKVHVDSWRSTYKGILPDDFLAALSYEQREQLCHSILVKPMPNSVIYVVEDDRMEDDGLEDNGVKTASPNIVGFASAGRERSGDSFYTGELYTLYLRQAYQGQGLGRQLMMATVKHLLEAGLNSLLVWVLADNPTCGFYAALGGQPIYQKTETIGGTPLIEIGYGWQQAAIILGEGA